MGIELNNMLSQKLIKPQTLGSVTQFAKFDFGSRPDYPNLRVHKLKYKSMAREKRKQTRRLAMGGIKTPKEMGEEQPPFYLPPRYKLMFKVLTANKNCTRIGRKPMSDDLMADFVKQSKEYHAYKQYEKMQVEREQNNMLKH